MVNCTVPMLYLRCYRCLVISHDGSGHTSPCMPKYTISGLRTDIYAKPIYQMFQFRVKKSDGVVHYLNIDSGRFEVLDGQSLLCPATDGILDSFSGEKYLRLTYSACAFKRFSIVIAVLMNGCWRLRYRIVPSAVHGILVFKMRSTLHFTNGRVILPDDFKLNTILVVGIKPSGSFKINFRIFANEDGLKILMAIWAMQRFPSTPMASTPVPSTTTSMVKIINQKKASSLIIGSMNNPKSQWLLFVVNDVNINSS